MNGPGEGIGCAIDRLTHVEIKLFERFPRTREVEAQVISPRGQSAQELTPEAARLMF